MDEGGCNNCPWMQECLQWLMLEQPVSQAQIDALLHRNSNSMELIIQASPSPEFILDETSTAQASPSVVSTDYLKKLL